MQKKNGIASYKFIELVIFTNPVLFWIKPIIPDDIFELTLPALYTFIKVVWLALSFICPINPEANLPELISPLL